MTHRGSPESAVASVELDFTPDASTPSRGREFLVNACAELLPDRELSFRLGVAAHELLENVLKYASGGKRSVSVGFQKSNGTTQAYVRSRNRAGQPQLTRLSNTIDRIRNSDAPDDLYDSFIEAGVDGLGSGLGLIRIRAEALMDLAYDIEDDTVTILATLPIEGRSRC